MLDKVRVSVGSESHYSKAVHIFAPYYDTAHELASSPLGATVVNENCHVIRLDPKKNRSRHVSTTGSLELRRIFSGAYGSFFHNKEAMWAFKIYCNENEAVALALELGKCFPTFGWKSESKSKSDAVINFPELNLAENKVSEINALLKGQTIASYLCEAPPNYVNVPEFVNAAKEIAERAQHISFEAIHGKAALAEKKLGGIYAVGQGAPHEPALVIVKLQGESDEDPIAICGKGIVYDTGGLGIKTPKNFMFGMKRDCGGAAAIVGLFSALADLGVKPKKTVYGLLCMAENSIGSQCYRNDDIVTMHSGRTVEINNTDAEGRMVLGDGVSYASRILGCTTVLDIATLTGASSVTVGNEVAALLTNREEMETKIRKIGRECGETAFPMIYAPEQHFSELNSNVADQLNSALNRSNALCSVAGLFINSHLKDSFDFDGTWAHLDIARPAAEYGSKKHSTGFGTTLLYSILHDIAF